VTFALGNMQQAIYSKHSVYRTFARIPHAFTLTAASLALLVMFGGLGGCASTGSDDANKKPDNVLWPLPPETPRYKFVGYLFSEDQVTEAASGMSVMRDKLLGKPREAGRQLKKPYAVHADKSGRVYVADSGWGKVLVFDPQNKKFAIWGEHGQGILAKPLGIASDKHGYIYVTDSAKQRVVIFDQNGEFVRAMGKKGELERPVGIAVDQYSGKTYVVDTKSHNIAVYSPQGGLLTKIGKRGMEPGEFNFPTNITIGPAGKIYVADSMNFRVQVLDNKGKPLMQFGSNGDARGQFARPKGIEVDSQGNIYVVDSAFNNFQVFNPEGKLLMALGGGGRKPGEFQLPAGMYIDDNDQIYVADQYNWRIQIFEFLKNNDHKSEGSITRVDTEASDSRNNKPRAGGARPE